jgi:hypothetical protein
MPLNRAKLKLQTQSPTEMNTKSNSHRRSSPTASGPYSRLAIGATLFVAQTFSLLYRRVSLCGSLRNPRSLRISTLAAWNSAVGRYFLRSRAGLFLLIAVCATNVSRADALSDPNVKIKVPPVVSLSARAFPLETVRLLDGPFKHAMELDQNYLLSLEVDRLLHNFRINAGLPSTAEPLGGWEDPKGELRGHFVGHYLSACALMYASTADRRFKEKGDAVVAGLAECQAKLGSGYLSAYPESFIDRVEKRSRVWAPYYTLHKILAGLLDMYESCNNRQALEVAKRFGDWVIERNSHLTEEQMQGMLGNEHGGMNEALANLYGLTGEQKYLKISLRFNHHRVLDPAEQREDKLTGLHANTQIPKFIGNARQYELTGDTNLEIAAKFFWTTVVKERSYVIGGHSDGEMFSAKEKLSQALGPNTTETCNTYNMLKLTRHLFCWEPLSEYADYYERALYNHILASQNPQTGMMCYYLPLRNGSRKNYNGPTDSFWCCTGTGVENHSKYGDSIYFHSDHELYVNLFIASELNWKEKGLNLRQETKYPDQSATRLIFECEKPVELTLKLRHPFWSASDFGVKLNGRPQAVISSPGSWIRLDHAWQTKDTIEIEMPFHLRTEAFKDNPNRFALLNGPIVLCAQVDLKRPFPAVVPETEDFLAQLQPASDEANTFTGPAQLFRVPGEAAQPVTLMPLYKMYSHNYEVYWDRYTPQQWQVKQLEYAAELQKRKTLEARTVDYVNPGEEQNERDHNLQGEKTSAGDFGDHKYRDASEKGWFSWDLKVLADKSQDLVLTYWGEDRGRHFDVLVDGQKLATQGLTANHPGVYFDQSYPLTPEITRGKQKVTVKIQGSADTWAGGVFGVRILKPE